ncbi:hypothetical protein ACS5PK_10465 [Roseateles sp. DB2]|uniref:hypothetical protein n=1 Tax=Roseateles sp. DB2 TaxID=3453717 RepID=UPI003EE8FF38
MQITPQAPRYQLSINADGLQAAIPARRSTFALLFLLLWLGGWAFGEMQAIEQLLHPSDMAPTAFLALWLAGWTAGGLAAVGTLLWQIAGRELLTVNATALAHRIEVFGLGLTRNYAAHEVKALRAAPDSALAQYQALLPPFMGPARGALAFDYGARTIRLAPGIDEAEARELAAQLASRLPAAARAAA